MIVQYRLFPAKATHKEALVYYTFLFLFFESLYIQQVVDQLPKSELAEDNIVALKSLTSHNVDTTSFFHQ